MASTFKDAAKPGRMAFLQEDVSYLTKGCTVPRNYADVYREKWESTSSLHLESLRLDYEHCLIVGFGLRGSQGFLVFYMSRIVRLPQK